MEQKASLGKVGVPEENYKADLELMDRCQAYSAELVRLALLGVAGLSFLFVQLASSQNLLRSLKDPVAVLILSLSVLLFLLSTLFGLLHRYNCWEAFWSHVRSIRCIKVEPPRPEDARKSSEYRNTILKRSSKYLWRSAILLWVGGILFVLGAGRLVFKWLFSA